MRVVVSFTTIPSRIGRIDQMVNSVINQTRKPDRVILWLPEVCTKENRGYDIPANLQDWLKQNNIEVTGCDRDWGSATKLIPTLFLENDPDTILITLDDDVYYDSHAIEELVNASEKYPDVSLGFMGGLPGPRFVHAEQLHIQGIDRIAVDGLGGYRGILYRRWMFDHTVVNELAA